MKNSRWIGRIFYTYIFVVFFLSLIPVPGLSFDKEFIWGWDKWIHSILYLIGGMITVLWVHSRDDYLGTVFRFGTTLVIGLLLSSGTEFLQSLTPYRSASLWDFTADLVGFVIGMIFMQWASSGLRRGWRKGSTLMLWILILTSFSYSGVGKEQSEEPALFPVTQVEPGMIGHGLTTLQGQDRSEFEVEILGVIPHILPGLDLIVGKLKGEAIIRTGVFAGMSGSPVYIEDQLLGAVAYAFPFASEAIAGIVPMEAMYAVQKEAKDIRTMSQSRPIARLDERRWYDLAKSLMVRSVQDAPIDPGALLRNVLDSFRPANNSPAGAFPIPTVWSGAPTWESWLPENLVPATVMESSLRGTNAKLTKDNQSTVEPGMPIAIPLIQGDLNLSAYGTITAVQGNRLFAFGHYLFNLGNVEFPVNRARVVTVVPSLQSSFVMASTGDSIGTLDTDVWTTVSGTIGSHPKLTQIKILMNNEKVQRKFNYQMVRHPLLTPYLFQQLMSINLVLSPLGGFHEGSIRSRLRLVFEGYPDLLLENVFTGFSAVNDTSQFNTAILAFLLNNPFESLVLKEIHLELNQSRSSILASLMEARILTQDVRAGHPLPLVIRLQPRQHRPEDFTADLNLPVELPPGDYLLMVGGADLMNMVDAAYYGRFIRFIRMRDIFRMLENIRRNDGVYVRLLRFNPTLLSEGKVLRNLPLQVFNQMQSQGTRGAYSISPMETVLEKRFDWPYIVDGIQQFLITIKPMAQSQESLPVNSTEEDR